MPLSTTDTKPANKIFRGVGMEAVSQSWQPPWPPATSHWCSTLSPSPCPAGRRHPLLELPGIRGPLLSQLCLGSSQSMSQSEATNELLWAVTCTQSQDMHEPDPRTPNPCGQTLTWPAPVIISCKAKQLGGSALLSLPSSFLFIVHGKKRLIKLRKYPFSPPS